MNLRPSLLCWLVVALLGLTLPSGAAPRKIVLIAGPLDSHPRDTHEYEKNVILLKHCLDTSPDARDVRTEIHLNGWPTDPKALDDADTIFLTSGGSDRREADHPLYVGDRLEQLARQMRRGCGLVLFHWSTFNPVRAHDQITEWVGGYFDYERGSAPNKWFSAIQTREWTATPGAPEHPICRGVQPFRLTEEFYFNLRFRENDPRLKPILLKDTPLTARSNIVAWAVERSDDGRGFGITGGHFYRNWWEPDFRRLILNALLWTARVEVPAGGVRSTLDPQLQALIVTGHQHPAHDWRAVTAALLPALEQDPRVAVEVTENPEELSKLIPPAMARDTNRTDLVVLNYANWQRAGLSEAARSALTNFVARGGGLAVIHFANGAFHSSLPDAETSDWPEYRRLVRRVWDHKGASGHDAYGSFRVEVTSRAHPITAGLAAFDTVDELYFRQAGDEPIGPLVAARSKVTKADEPLAWAYEYGAGRVFQTVLGHSEESIRHAAALIRRGCIWAARGEPLSFDPPLEPLAKPLFRPGSRWSPEISQKLAAAKAPAAEPEKAAPAKPVAKGLTGEAGSDPEKQKEADWVDNRWQQMDTGPFLASSIQLDNGTVLKALSVKLGERGEATACYDTATLNLRAGWAGGFLLFDPARYGLIQMPKPAGDIQFLGPTGPAWTGGELRYEGFQLHGRRIVFRGTVGGMSLLESPWAESTTAATVLTRTLELGPSATPLKLRVLDPTNTLVTLRKMDRTPIALLERQGRYTAVAALGDTNVTLRFAGDGTLVAEFPAHSTTLRCKLLYWRGLTKELQHFANAIRQSPPPENLTAMSEPAPGRWTPLTTRGQTGFGSDAYVIDTLTVPYDNPWKALLFLAGVDFLPNGDVAVCSIHGDVWLVSGIDEKLTQLTWRRFATGLFQPLGLQVVQGRVHVLGRDQITVLEDRNGDGEADFYKSFSQLIDTSAGGHDYVSSLEADDSGRFYYVDPRGAHRISADGRSRETVGTGWRNPNGMGVRPDGGVITVAPQEGEWTPASAICEARAEGYFGYPGPRVAAERPLGYDAPLCWIPHSVDNSGGSQLWVTSDRWGPLRGQMLHFSYGRCSMMLVLREVVEGQSQGGVVPMPGRFLSGALRGAFREQDGQLYVVGSRGWQTSALRDGSLQRVRYTGKKVHLPVELRAHGNGLLLRFTEPLQKETAEDTGSYGLQRWNYRYQRSYGSKDYSVSAPDKEGHDPLDVKAARLLPDGRSVFLEIPSLAPVMQMELKYNLRTSDGQNARGVIHHTINRLAAPFGG